MEKFVDYFEWLILWLLAILLGFSAASAAVVLVLTLAYFIIGWDAPIQVLNYGIAFFTWPCASMFRGWFR